MSAAIGMLAPDNDTACLALLSQTPGSYEYCIRYGEKGIICCLGGVVPVLVDRGLDLLQQGWGSKQGDNRPSGKSSQT